MMALSMPEQEQLNIVQVVRDYGKRLFAFIRNRVRSDADAEDILQDVWYQFSNVVNTEPIDQLSGWLFKVARNKVTDRFRKQKPQSLTDLEFENEDGEINFRDLLLADYTTPETEHLRAVFWEELFAALDELPEEQRNVFIWNELEDQTFQEIADRTGINIKTLISRKGYAVRHLRKRMETLYREIVE
jgi:RNA polymerase sigma factor (sigma-70 family)